MTLHGICCWLLVVGFLVFNNQQLTTNNNFLKNEHQKTRSGKGTLFIMIANEEWYPGLLLKKNKVEARSIKRAFEIIVIVLKLLFNYIMEMPKINQ